MASSACSRSCPLRSCGAEGAERGGAEPSSCWAVAGAVSDCEPGAVAVFDEVEPFAADFVGGEEAAGELGAGDAGDPRREQFCWISAAGVVSFRRRAASITSV